MDVILLQKMGKIGDVGDKVTVKAGYARNYLFPFSKAIPATKLNVAEFEVRKDELLKASAEKMQGEEKRAALLAGISVTIEANASEEGKLYGSVGTREITDAVAANGQEIDKSEVELPDGPLHEVGEHNISLILSPEVSTEIKVTIVASGAGPDAVIEPEEPVADDSADDDSADEAASE